MNNTATKISPKRLLNVKEAANYLGVSNSAIYKYIEFGRIAYRRLPGLKNSENIDSKATGKLVFEITDLDKFVENQTIRFETINKKL
jgi:excisionase family DNA binding protein